jgi:hypothetical protein
VHAKSGDFFATVDNVKFVSKESGRAPKC